VASIIRARYSRDPYNGDVYMFMSKNYTKVKMIHFEKHAFYLHEKSFTNGYKFMKIKFVDDRPVYSIDWKDLVVLLETPVVTEIKLGSQDISIN
jgi:hypothetical protein